MTISIDFPTRVITVEQSDLTLVSGVFYELDLDVFRLALRDIEDSEEGMLYPKTHTHTTTSTLGSTTFARVIEIINLYTVTFEDLSYAVDLVGANSNILDVTNLNSVSVRANNSAGLIQTATSGLTSAESALLTSIDTNVDSVIDLLCNNANISVNGSGIKTVTIYEDDGTTIRAQVTISADGLTRTRVV